MMKFAVALLALITLPASLHACWSYVPLEHTVDEAEYVLHLKVVKVIEQEGEADDGRFPPDYAVCEINEVLMGLIVTNADGHVCVTSAARRNETRHSADVTYQVGDVFTLVAPGGEIVRGHGMVFNGGGHPNRHAEGSPSRRLRELVQARMDNAYALLDKFDKLVPGARAEAEKAVIEHEDGRRTDFTDVSPEADLLLDLVATNRGAPAEAKGKRPELDAKTRERLAALALRVVCGVTAPGAKIAVKLTGGTGHGAKAMIAPADLPTEQALPILQQLDDAGELNTVLPHLVRHDVARRAVTWAAHLSLKGGSMGKLGEWLCIEHISNESGGVRDLARTIAPKQGRDCPYADSLERTLARLVDAEAWALCTIFESAAAVELSNPTGDQPDMETHNQRVKALEELHKQPAFLAAYTFLKAIGASESGLDYMERKLKQARRYVEDDGLDLEDYSSLEWHVRMEYGSVPPVLKRAIKNRD